MSSRDLLKSYREKRDFTRTPEPRNSDESVAESSDAHKAGAALSFVIQKHAARNLHYDFRLELDGTLKSWAVPKGPSLDPSVKRMGVHVEDHPLSYATFEGQIPERQYGAGDVIVWDRGQWAPLGDPVAGLKAGKLKFDLFGEKLKGGWTLVRMHAGPRKAAPAPGEQGHEPWLLIKEKDAHARKADEFDVLVQAPNSVLSGRPLPDKGGKLATPTIVKSKTTSNAKPASNRKIAVAKEKTIEAESQGAGYLPEGARHASLPATLAPQLATLLDTPPSDPQGWLYEIKFDGYRLLTRIDGDSVKCFTRNGHDWTSRLQALAKALSQTGISSGWLDGEIVVLNDGGTPDFGALQNAFDSASSASTANIVYFVFDLPFFDGVDLRQVKLVERREILRTVLTRFPQDNIRFSEAFEHPPQDLLISAGQLGLEGVIGKRSDSPYASGRTRSWVKLKTQQRQEFVIGGYTAPKGARSGFGALMLGVHGSEGQLRYAGNVGTGFDEKTLAALKTRLAKIHDTHNPFTDAPGDLKGQWVKPELLAEVAFGEWTSAGRIRHAVFKGLRADKPAKNIVREAASKPASAPASQPAKAINPFGKLRVTHPDRVIDASSGFTKQDMIAHYAAVASLILPHLKSRPTSLVRAPSGITGELFFQKHAEATSIPGIKLLDPTLDPGHAPLLELPTAMALLEAAQMNVIEFHTWNATTRAIHQPDRMTFDLDPGEGVGWAEVQEAAQLVRTMLDELQLANFLKTSGGKGLHVVVPLRTAFDFDTVKDFSHAIVDHLARVVPQRFVAKSGPKNRIGKIFVDYLRNGFGATTVAAWSVRARAGLGVSVPVGWDELPALTSGAHWSAGHMDARLAIGNQPWANYEKSRNSLSGAMKQLGFKARP
jgi:bifunctional non-homologous end joining protein LigD